MRKFWTVAVLAAAVAAACASQASAQTYKRIHSFCRTTDCPDGYQPNGVLARDADGNLYGMTNGGGIAGAGTVFELSPTATGWRYKVLYSFCSQASCTDGRLPFGGVILDAAGDIYGTTEGGGVSDAGTLFELVKRHGQRTLRILHTFCAGGISGCTEGIGPWQGLAYAGKSAGLPYDGTSPLYGSTLSSGSGWGTLFAFERAPHGKRRVLRTLYSFCAQSGCADGSKPSGLALDGDGNLFGTTNAGGTAGAGTLFELGADGTYTVLHQFCSVGSCADGSTPAAGVYIDAAGSLYGTNTSGGAQNDGVVYEVSFDGGTPQFSVLHDFCSFANCADGEHSLATLTGDGNGNLFGTTEEGGNAFHYGVLFEINQTTYTVLHEFGQKNRGRDGSSPTFGVLLAPDGTLFGTTLFGGLSHGGTAFALKP